MDEVMTAYNREKIFRFNDIIETGTFYELFGADFFLDSNGKVYLIEVNINPGMKPHDERDKKLRKDVFAQFIRFTQAP